MCGDVVVGGDEVEVGIDGDMEYDEKWCGGMEK